MARWRAFAFLNACCMLAFLFTCSPTAAATASTQRAASRWFPYQQGWLGADGAYSVPLGHGRSLWFFDDTFVGPPAATSREHYTSFIHNTLGISTCSGLRCSFHYYWKGQRTPKPGPIFVAPGSDWFWPMDAFLFRGTLYVALMQMHAAGSGAFGFAYSGSQLASIRNYTAPPSQWSITYQPLNTGGAVVPGVSIVADQGPGGNPDPENPQGASYAYFFTAVGSPPYLALLRIPLADLDHLGRPGSSAWQYLTTAKHWKTWKDTETTLPADNARVLDPGATEMTVRWHSSTHQWLGVYPSVWEKTRTTASLLRSPADGGPRRVSTPIQSWKPPTRTTRPTCFAMRSRNMWNTKSPAGSSLRTYAIRRRRATSFAT